MAYQPTEWEHGDIITGGKLNKIEEELTHVADNATYGFGGAQLSSDGLTPLSYINAGDPMPSNPQKGDTVFLKDGNDFLIYSYNGEDWVLKVDPDLSNRIEETIKTASDNTDKAIADNNTQINETINQVAKEQADLAIKDGDFNNKAQAMADKALSDAKANTAAVAQSTLDSANQNIATAKASLNGDIAKEISDRKAAIATADTKAKGYADSAKNSVTDSLNKEVSDRNAAVSELDTKAQGYADSAKQDAINAATTADGTINKKIDDTATSLTSKITQNKQDADGKITTAQSTATQALNEVKTKVSQTEYNTKTGQLTTDVNSVTQTANQSKQDIVSINQKDGQQDSRMNSIESDASGTKQTISDIQKNDGQQDSKIATITSDISGLNAKWVQAQSDINDLGQTNQLFNTEFSPDFEGWVPNGMSPEIYGVIDGSNVLKLTTANNNNWNNFRQQITNIRPNGILSASIFVGDNTGTGTFTVDSYDSSGKRTVVAQKAISSQSTKLILEGITIPTDSVSVFVGVWSNENGEILTISQPMVVFNPTVGRYVQGNYSNNGKVATLSAGIDGLNGQFSQYKTTNDGKVSKAQADILANTSSIATKVSQTDYDKKTGDLTTFVNNVTQTANQSKQDIVSINQKDGQQDSRMNSIESDASGTRQTVSDIQTIQGNQSGSITTLQSRADGVDVSVANIKNQVNSLGQTNQLINTEFNPDFASWGAANAGGFVPTLGTPVNGSNSIKLVHSATTSWQSYRQKIISAVPGTVLSASIFISESDGTNWSLAIDSYNASGTRTIIRAVSLTKSGLFTLQNLVVPDNSKSVYFSLWAQQPNAKLTFSKPMFVFNNIVGDYVQGSYSDIEGISKAQLTADQATLSIQNYKADADGRITKAQSDITQTANQVATKVSQTDYDTKTGDLTTKVSKAQQTADSATTTIGSYKTSNDNRVAAAETKISQNTDAVNLRATKTDLDSAKNDYTAKISQVNIDINGIESSVSDIQGEVASQQITIDGITSTVTQQGKDINSVTSRVQTAEGNISTATNNISGMQTKITQTANQVSQEITDRTKGDSNTLQSSKDFTTSQINNSETGTKSLITQTADGIMAKVDTKTDSDTVLSLLKDNWSIGISDNIGKITSGIVGNASQMSLISKNVTIDSPNTQIKGTAWIQSAMIANGAIGNAQIGDATITSAKIAQLDVAKLTGNVSSFIQSNWNGLYQSVKISPIGMTISTSQGSTAQFNQDGLLLDGALGTTNVLNGQIELISSKNEYLGTFQHETMPDHDNVDYLMIKLAGWHTSKPGDSDYDLNSDGTNTIRGGDGIGFGVTNSVGTYDMKMSWDSSLVAGYKGRKAGWHVEDIMTWHQPTYFEGGIDIAQQFSSTDRRALHIQGATLSNGHKWFGFFDTPSQAGFGTDDTNDVLFYVKGKSYSLYTMLNKLNML